MYHAYMVSNGKNIEEIKYALKEMLDKFEIKYYVDRNELEFRVGVYVYNKLHPLMESYYYGERINSIYGVKVELDWDMIPNEVVLKSKSKELIIPQFNLLGVKISNSTLPKKYIVNDKATILFWEDGTKTIVKKSKNDIFDPVKSYLWAYFQKHSGMSKTKANKYLAEINDNN